MKKVLTLTAVILVVSITASMAFALPNMRARAVAAIATADKLGFKNMLANYMRPELYGNGIGFNSNNYLTATWYIVDTRTLSLDQIKSVIASSNATTWAGIQSDVRDALQTEGTNVSKGRISVSGTNYLLSNIVVSTTSASADINILPNYTACTQQNVSASDCESNAQKVGDISIAAKTSPTNKTNVWAGTMDFDGTAYTFVTFAYTR